MRKLEPSNPNPKKKKKKNSFKQEKKKKKKENNEWKTPQKEIHDLHTPWTPKDTRKIYIHEFAFEVWKKGHHG